MFSIGSLFFFSKASKNIQPLPSFFIDIKVKFLRKQKKKKHQESLLEYYKSHTKGFRHNFENDKNKAKGREKYRDKDEEDLLLFYAVSLSAILFGKSTAENRNLFSNQTNQLLSGV